MDDRVEEVELRFRNKLQECTFETYKGRPYVLVAKLKDWLLGGSDVDLTSSQRIGLLLHAAYRHRNLPSLPITSDVLRNPTEPSLLVFCILMQLNHGHLIHQFTRNSIHDSFLGDANLWSIKQRFESMNIPDHEQLAMDFDRLQWQFCPVIFEQGMGYVLPEKRILPIYKKEPLNGKGGNAEVWQVEIQEEFVGPVLRSILCAARFNDLRDRYGYRYEFALKRFRHKSSFAYEAERRAFQSLRGHDGMIHFIGDYQQKETLEQSPSEGYREESTRLTSSILLEYGENDLDEFFHDHLPPVLQNEVEDTWEQIGGIAKAVHQLHDLKTSHDGVTSELQGWHADIKPDNILRVRGKFKLADPGFATFQKKTDQLAKFVWQGGTETYGAPECRPDRSSQGITQAIDVWSLGCVLSISATWVVLGYQGTRQYQRVRQKAISKMNTERESLRPPKKPSLFTDSFHDGDQMLSAVSEWHIFLRKCLRQTDTVTSKILDLVEHRMLIADAGLRISSCDLHTEISEILSQSRRSERLAIPGEIEAALQELDQEVPEVPSIPVSHIRSNTSGLAVPSKVGRQARKSSRLEAPLMKTSNRSQYQESTIRESGIAVPPMPHLPKPDTKEGDALAAKADTKSHPATLSQTSISELRMAQSEDLAYQESAGYSRRSLLPRRQVSTSDDSLDFFQALQLLDGKVKGFSSKLRASLGISKEKDALLTRHYGDRDIIFLIDNGASMKHHWHHATLLLDVLVRMLVGQDPDGIDAFFTNGKFKIDKENNASKFFSAMDHKDVKPMEHVNTDIQVSLSDFFSGQLQQRKLKQRQTKRYKFTLIVLTDGMWEATPDRNEVYKQIIEFIRQVSPTTAALKDRPVSIQFIQFGDDEQASQILADLDDKPIHDGVPDVIDTEPALGGDIYKMLLGSFNAKYDLKDSEMASGSGGSGSAPTSPLRISRPPTILTGRDMNESPSPVQGQQLPPPKILMKQATSKSMSHSS